MLQNGNRKLASHFFLHECDTKLQQLAITIIWVVEINENVNHKLCSIFWVWRVAAFHFDCYYNNCKWENCSVSNLAILGESGLGRATTQPGQAVTAFAGCGCHNYTGII
jgi:hypothetical protein